MEGIVWTAAVLILMFMGGCMHIGYRFYRLYRIYRLIEHTPTTNISDLVDGRAKVEGKIFAVSKPLKGPISGTRCVYYHFKQTEPAPKLDPEKGDIDIIETEVPSLCGVGDGSGVIELNLELAGKFWSLNTPFLGLSKPLRWANIECDPFTYVDTSLRGSFYDIPDVNRRYIYREKTLKEGSNVCVFGYVKLRPGTHPCFIQKNTPFGIPLVLFKGGGKPSLSRTFDYCYRAWEIAAVLGLGLVVLLLWFTK